MNRRKNTPSRAKVVAEANVNSRRAVAQLRRLASPDRAAVSARFFKTGPGEYGEGDRFIGVRVPEIRTVAKQFRDLPLAEIKTLLRSEIHEERLLALVILVGQFDKGDEAARKRIHDFYLANARWVNNWDLVDLSAPTIVGGYLENRSRRPVHRLAKSDGLWQRRIAVLATFHFIRRGDFDDTFKVAEMLLADREDLIHKAVGWMLREVGKRDTAVLETFLKKHHRAMPRTMLRYAIERFPAKKRQAYLKAHVKIT
ncbi:MAG TPA: DNA alkylation repair protein [Thermoguttaceae bacterium]|nr:DNA alkylation repair protein [Thermoguttaceae bacterium]